MDIDVGRFLSFSLLRYALADGQERRLLKNKVIWQT
jgi:hypothetical protein